MDETPEELEQIRREAEEIDVHHYRRRFRLLGAIALGAAMAGLVALIMWMLDAKRSGLVFTPVQVVSIDDASVHVTGLAAGSQVVSVGAQKLDAGTAVRAIERTADTAATTVAKSSQ